MPLQCLMPKFAVVLTEVGQRRIEVVKELRDLTDLDLREIVEMLKGLPVNVLGTQTREEAARAKKRFTRIGATVRISKWK
jgi:large subunit ribosomal protein L7/L12